MRNKHLLFLHLNDLKQHAEKIRWLYIRVDWNDNSGLPYTGNW